MFGGDNKKYADPVYPITSTKFDSNIQASLQKTILINKRRCQPVLHPMCNP